MKLGAMLVRDGRLTPAQIEAAVAQQARVGGRLGTVLVEMRLIDADTLTVYLGLELGIPIATRAALDRAKRAAVKLLTPELSERFLCVPLVVQDRALIAAMRDPHDLLALDELGASTGHRVIPRVAPEVRLHYYIERYYGVPRPDRFRKLGDFIIAPQRPTAEDVEPPAPPLPGLPPPSESPIMAPSPAPALRAIHIGDEGEVTDPGASLHVASPSPSLLDEAYDDLAMELAADSAEPADIAPAIDAATAPSGVDDPDGPDEGSAPIDNADGELDIGAALAGMALATSRAQIAEAMIGYARAIFDVGALLVVRDDMAFGWKGFGTGLEQDRVETLMIPLDASSVFKAAIDANDLFVGAVPDSALHAHLFRILRVAPPRQVVVVPVIIKNRVVNLLYGQRNEGVLGDYAIHGLRHLSRAASTAYVKLIALQKKPDTEPGVEPDAG